MLKVGGGGVDSKTTMKKVSEEYKVQSSIKKKSNSSRGGHWYAIPPFRCEPVAKSPSWDAATEQGLSLPGLGLRDERDVGFYIDLQHKYIMVLSSEVILTMGCSTGPGKGFHREEAP